VNQPKLRLALTKFAGRRGKAPSYDEHPSKVETREKLGGTGEILRSTSICLGGNWNSIARESTCMNCYCNFLYFFIFFFILIQFNLIFNPLSNTRSRSIKQLVAWPGLAWLLMTEKVRLQVSLPAVALSAID
jgi:hypothetical protein